MAGGADACARSPGLRAKLAFFYLMPAASHLGERPVVGRRVHPAAEVVNENAIENAGALVIHGQGYSVVGRMRTDRLRKATVAVRGVDRYPSAGAEGYNIEQICPEHPDDSMHYGPLPASQTTFHATGLIRGGTYYSFRVAAINAAGTSAYCEVEDVQTQNDPPTIPEGHLPSAAQSPVIRTSTTTGTSTTLTVLGADDGGEIYVTYSWSVVSAPGDGDLLSCNPPAIVALAGDDHGSASVRMMGLALSPYRVEMAPPELNLADTWRSGTVTSNFDFTDLGWLGVAPPSEAVRRALHGTITITGRPWGAPDVEYSFPENLSDGKLGFVAVDYDPDEGVWTVGVSFFDPDWHVGDYAYASYFGVRVTGFTLRQLTVTDQTNPGNHAIATDAAFSVQPSESRPSGP